MKEIGIRLARIGVLVSLVAAAASSRIPAKTLIDYFLPAPIRGPRSPDIWAGPQVGPRDAKNGLEDPTCKQWSYWDGQIIKGPAGRYHVFASRWDQASGQRGWSRSLAVHAVSDNPIGPYEDKGLCWPGDQAGKGHNVAVMVRPDGDFQIIARSGAIWISKDGLLGPYVVQGPSICQGIPELPKKDLEDPVIWYSGGLYYIFVNCWSARKAYHLTSPNGIDDWMFRVLAYDPTADFIRYTDGTVNHWYKIERPSVLIIDVPKDQDRGNDSHGSKAMVALLDGPAFDRDMQALAGPDTQGKASPRPLYLDPVYDAPTDPVLCFNAESGRWFMYYTARRGKLKGAPGVSWVHGTDIGMAESEDGGATWTYRGVAQIDYGKDQHPDDYTYWAPEVIWAQGLYHMFLSFVPGIFTDWNHPRQIVHLTSKDGIRWDAIGPVELKSDRVIDACVIRLQDGTWRMWYKDERRSPSLCYADSSDLMAWTPKGNAVTDFNGEGPKVFRWQGWYWLIADCWRNGMRVWRSDDCLNWQLQDEQLPRAHGDAVVSGGRAWWFYFTEKGRSAAINVVELYVKDDRLLAQEAGQTTYIDLRPQREQEQ